MCNAYLKLHKNSFVGQTPPRPAVETYTARTCLYLDLGKRKGEDRDGTHGRESRRGKNPKEVGERGGEIVYGYGTHEIAKSCDAICCDCVIFL